VSDRILGTVLFTDIVGSTERLATLGDQAAKLLDTHDAMVRTTTGGSGASGQHYGDGFLYTSTVRHVRCGAGKRSVTARGRSGSTCAREYTSASANHEAMTSLVSRCTSAHVSARSRSRGGTRHLDRQRPGRRFRIKFTDRGRER